MRINNRKAASRYAQKGETMKTIKIFLVFVLGVVSGGLIFGFQGPAPSQAGSNLPSDLFSLQASYTDKQRLCIKSKYRAKYKVTKAFKTGDICIGGFISTK
jgi:hypothetical protein